MVWGCGVGIGRACAVAFAREGCNVAVVARTESGLRETAAQCVAAAPGCKVAVIVADVTKVPTALRTAKQGEHGGKGLRGRKGGIANGHRGR